MKKSLVLFSSILTVFITVACGVERTSTVLGPTTTSDVKSSLAPGVPTSNKTAIRPVASGCSTPAASQAGATSASALEASSSSCLSRF